MNTPIFELNPSDWPAMLKLMDEYSDSDSPFSGIDECGNRVLISVNRDNITTQTFQSNGWIRTNIYNRFGENEELYER